MTLAAAWVRRVNSCEELVFISDSRLCAGNRWDECPKIMTLPGENSAMAFAGETAYAYPMMMQVRQAMAGYRRIYTRAMDVVEIGGHILHHLNHLINSVYDDVSKTPPDVEFIYGGYSWVRKAFVIYTYKYSGKAKSFVMRKRQPRVFPNIQSQIAVIGDQKENYKKKLRDKLTESCSEHEPVVDGLLGMEPFQVLCDMLRNVNKADTIGGAPQMLKVYQYMNSCHVGVYWPKKIDSISNRTILGRTLFDYEDNDAWFIDPDTLYTEPSRKGD